MVHSDPGRIYRWRVAKRKSGSPDEIRLLTDGLIDGQGLRWDQITGADMFYMNAEEAEPFISSAWRYLSTNGWNNRGDILQHAEFLDLVKQSLDHPVQAYRASDNSGRVIVTIDTLNC